MEADTSGTTGLAVEEAPRTELRDAGSEQIISAIRQSNRESAGDASDLERMACLGRMVAMVSHELNNRLTGVLGFADLLAMKCEGESSARIKTKLSDCAERLRLLTESLSGFSMSKVRREEDIRLEHVFKQAIEVVKCEAKATGVSVEYQSQAGSEKARANLRAGDLRVGLFLCLSTVVKLAAKKNQPVKITVAGVPNGTRTDLSISITAGDSPRSGEGQMAMAREMLEPLGIEINWSREGQVNVLSLLIPGGEGETADTSECP